MGGRAGKLRTTAQALAEERAVKAGATAARAKAAVTEAPSTLTRRTRVAQAYEQSKRAYLEEVRRNDADSAEKLAATVPAKLHDLQADLVESPSNVPDTPESTMDPRLQEAMDRLGPVAKKTLWANLKADDREKFAFDYRQALPQFDEMTEAEWEDRRAPQGSGFLSEAQIDKLFDTHRDAVVARNAESVLPDLAREYGVDVPCLKSLFSHCAAPHYRAVDDMKRGTWQPTGSAAFLADAEDGHDAKRH